jgi:hypothetical protein
LSLLTPAKSSSVHLTVLACNSFEHVQQVYLKSKKDLGEILSAVEFFDRASMDLVLKHLPGTRDPFEDQHPFYIVIETSGSNQTHDYEVFIQN